MWPQQIIGERDVLLIGIEVTAYSLMHCVKEELIWKNSEDDKIVRWAAMDQTWFSYRRQAIRSGIVLFNLT